MTCPLVPCSGRQARPPSAAPQANAGRAWLSGELAKAGGAKRLTCIFKYFMKKDFSIRSTRKSPRPIYEIDIIFLIITIN